MDYSRLRRYGFASHLRLRYMLVALLLIGVLQAAGVTAPIPSAKAGPARPWYTWSFYLTTVDTNVAYSLGYSQGQHDLRDLPYDQHSAVILMFGQATDEIGNYGTYIYDNNATGVTVSQIADFAQQFGWGYWNGVQGEPNSTLTVVIGTGNSGNRTYYYGHGDAWARMVNSVQQYYVNNGIANQVTAVAGSDMEMDWNTPGITRSWVDGYAGARQQQMYDFGDSGGCPQQGDGTTNGACNNGWTQDDVWYVSWGASPAWPFPQIYRTDGAQADQWKQLSLYAAVSKYGRMYFGGALTQQGSCYQRGCPSTTANSPETGWDQLWYALNSDSRIAMSPNWSSDIRYR